MYTPGPWYWVKYPKTHTIRLIGDRQYVVMGFGRWGMQSAQPRFSDRNGEIRGGVMEDASQIDLSTNPDACLIAEAPNLLNALKEIAAIPAYAYADNEAACRMVDIAIAAIAKAEPKP